MNQIDTFIEINFKASVLVSFPATLRRRRETRPVEAPTQGATADGSVGWGDFARVFFDKRFAMNTTMKKLALAMGALVMAGGAWAVDTSTMGVGATVAAECAVGNGGGIAFSTLDMLNLDDAIPTAVDSTAASTFPAICTNGTAAPTFTYVSANALTSDFRLKGVGATANDYITYTPYSSVNGTGTAIVGGVPTTYGGAVPFVANGTSQILNLSAKIIAADKATKLVQAYTDTITITAGWTP